jgi:AraC-like DNA-binding protein
MQAVRRSLLILHPDAKLRARVQQAAGREFAVQVVSSWDELNDALGKASPAAFAVVDPYAGADERSGPAPELRDLLHAFPSVAVLAAVELRSSHGVDLHTLGVWGVRAIIVSDRDDVAALVRLLQEVRGRPLQALLERSLPKKVSAEARSILAAVSEVAAAGGNVGALARRLHVSERTLLRWCESAQLPPPRQLLAWMRILLAAELLENAGHSIDSVAGACGYAAESGLRRTFYDFLGMSPKALREQGGFATAARAFRKVLREARSTPAPAKQPDTAPSSRLRGAAPATPAAASRAPAGAGASAASRSVGSGNRGSAP